MAQNSRKPLLTPKGVFVFPKLITPDTYKGKTTFNSKLRVHPNDPGVQQFIEKLEVVRDEGVEAEKAKLIAAGKGGAAKKVITRPVFKVEEDPKTGEETGFILFEVKMKTQFEDKKTGKIKKLRPTFFDSQGNSIDAPEDIWGGTVGRFGVKPAPTMREADSAMGTTLYLDAVFIIDLKAGGGRSASYYGFEAEEGGYVGGKAPASSRGYNSDDDDDDADADEDTDASDDEEESDF